MNERVFATLDGNEAVARVAYRLSEVLRHLPHHAIFAHGGMGRCLGLWRPAQHLGHGALGDSKCRVKGGPPEPSMDPSRPGH
jgi:hypothetical protein